MDVDPRAPVIVGAAQLAPAGGATDGPIALASSALRLAAEDTGVGEGLIRRAGALGHVATICWPYRDEAALIAAELGISPLRTMRTAQFGGDGPALLLAELASEIAAGRLDVALLSGAEAIATLRAAQRSGSTPNWPSQDAAAAPSMLLGSERIASNDAELAVDVAAPLYVYALLETAVQRRDGADRDAHQEEIARLWSRFSEVATGNVHAKLRRAVSSGDLLTVGGGNRWVSAPYTKLMTANADVDLATGIVMCSAQAATDAGVPPDRWVFVLAAAHAHEEWFVSERCELASAPALGAVGRAALEHAGLTIDDVAHVDLYSCFPSAVQIAAAELGLALDDDAPTVTGGLTFAGGPGNNYGGHAIAALVERLRADPDAAGFCTAVGWYMTKHAAIVLGGRPGRAPFRALEPAFERPPARRAVADFQGEATVEAYTIPYARDGAPGAAVVAALTPEGTRALARSSVPELVGAMVAEDPLGRTATVSAGVLEGLS